MAKTQWGWTKTGKSGRRFGRILVATPKKAESVAEAVVMPADVAEPELAEPVASTEPKKAAPKKKSNG